jgi:hypothetical protein
MIWEVISSKDVRHSQKPWCADHVLMFGIELRRPASEREVLSPLVFAVHVHRYHCVAMSFMTNQLEAVIGDWRSFEHGEAYSWAVDLKDF